MKGVISSKLEGLNNRHEPKSILLNYIVYPIRSGVFGFISFFIILTIAKYFGSILGASAPFKIDWEDMLLSLMGFVLVFLIKFLENFND